MLTDAHCHPYNLSHVFPQAEENRRALKVLAAASASDKIESDYIKDLSQKAAKDSAVPLLCCFAIHPQYFAVSEQSNIDSYLELQDELARQGSIAAIGECGFDLYNEVFKETEHLQDSFFLPQLETALRYNLPVVIHVRRAMHKIFALSRKLAQCAAVIFHSWPGTAEEALSLLRKGINVYFSFGNTIRLNHKQAMRSCARLPVDRLLTETDAPFQGMREYSQWADLPLIIEAAAALRCETANELEAHIESNFHRAFSV
jgi:TatD DNase family protein